MPFSVPFLTPGNPSPSTPCTGCDFTIHLLFLHSFIHNKCFTTCLLCIQLWASYFHRSYQSSCQPAKGKSVICILWRKQLGLRELVTCLRQPGWQAAELGFGTDLPASGAQPSPRCPACTKAWSQKAGPSEESRPLCLGERQVNWERRGGGEVGADQISTGVRGPGSFYEEDLEGR